MATAEELLAAEGVVDKTLVVDNDLRTIIIPEGVRNLGVASDMDVLTLDFRMPRYVSETDLSEFTIRINYSNSKGVGDVYYVTDAVIGDEEITFSWLVGRNATSVKGKTKFNICAILTNTSTTTTVIDKEFNTSPVILEVLEGLETSARAVTAYSDVLEQWRQDLYGGAAEKYQADITATGEATKAKIDEKTLDTQAFIYQVLDEAETAIDEKAKEAVESIPEEYATVSAQATEAYQSVRTKADAIVCSAQGEVISINDSSDDYLRGLTIYGKCTQETTTGAQLFDHPNIISNDHIKITDDGTITISCDNTDGESTKYVPFYTLASKLIQPATEYALVLEVFSSSNVGENIFLTSHYSDELCQFEDTASVTSPTVGTHIKLATTYDSFTELPDGAYMCRSFMSVPAGVKVDSRIRLSVIADTAVTADTFVYEPYTGGYASPSPDYPQDITVVSSPTLMLRSSNLIPSLSASTVNNGVTYALNSDGSITINGTATSYSCCIGTTFSVAGLRGKTLALRGSGTESDLVVTQIKFTWDGGYLFRSVNGRDFGTFEIPTDADYMRFEAYVPNGKTVSNVTIYPQLNLGEELLDYEPFAEPRYATFPSVVDDVDYYLRGIPVSSGGNYTDSDGQQWICNELDLERGKCVKRVAATSMDAYIEGDNISLRDNTEDEPTGTIIRFDIGYVLGSRINTPAFSDHFPYRYAHSDADKKTVRSTECISSHSTSDIISVFIDSNRLSGKTLDDVKAWLSNNKPVLIYALATPEEIDLSEEHIAAFQQLATNYPNTVITNARGAGMLVKYNADTETWINNAINAKIAAALANL